MSNVRPTPNRRRREVDPEEEARIAAFAQQAETLHPGPSEAEPTARPTVTISQGRRASSAKESKDKSYTFRMTEDTLNEFRAAAAEEDRSIQWIFDKVLLPALRSHRATK
ncbi:hypothetical protein LFT48_21695 (plasmid) [Arthrobacter sp. FW305-123]|nr:hypothetical protein LFT48_21695 [Arthrobacter sp. FW305-123]